MLDESPKSRRTRVEEAPKWKKVRAVLICAAQQTPISTRPRPWPRRRRSARNDAPRYRRAPSHRGFAISISRVIPSFSALFANALVSTPGSTRRIPASRRDGRRRRAEKKFAKLLTQKKCVASFRRNASHITTSDPNAPPSALRTRRSRPNGSGQWRAVRHPLAQCRGPLSRNCPARPRSSRRRGVSARRDPAANPIRADDPVDAGLPRRRASWLCLCYWASDTRHYAKPLTRSEPWLSRKLRRRPLRKR